MDFDIPPSNPEEPPGDYDTNIQVKFCVFIFIYVINLNLFILQIPSPGVLPTKQSPSSWLLQQDAISPYAWPIMSPTPIHHRIVSLFIVNIYGLTLMTPV